MKEKKKKETETEEKKKREHPMDRVVRSCSPWLPLEGIVATIYLRPTRKDTAEVGDIRPHTASECGFTMKFDWHLTLVRFIMAGVSYYQITEARINDLRT